MRYHILATDFDGTIADNGAVSQSTLTALLRLKAAGRKIILVTGRELEPLMTIFPQYTIFDMIVAENGALVYNPSTLKKILLGTRPPEPFIRTLKESGIPLSIGEVIVATWEPHQELVLEAIKREGLEYQLIFNKGAVMVLPPGVNKSAGLRLALAELMISEHNMVAVGDAENDNAMLQTSECGVAVSNAVEQLKSTADLITDGMRGEGVEELIDKIIQSDLYETDGKLVRHYLELGKRGDGTPFRISPYGANMLFAGSSGCGKTTLAAEFIGRLIEKRYQFCLIDPEGDYLDLYGAITIGDENQPPLITQVIKVLDQTTDNVIVCFLAIPLSERPAYFMRLNDALSELRNLKGHPHFIIIDESHHVLPKDIPLETNYFNENFNTFIAITTRPELLSRLLLERINMVIALGNEPGEIISSFLRTAGHHAGPFQDSALKRKDMLVWQRDVEELTVIRANEPEKLLMRHKRKYACGDMKYNSFYFTGPSHRLNLKASNLMLFIEMARGIDDETWLYHLRRHDYSNWLQYSVKDTTIAKTAFEIENSNYGAISSREAIFNLLLKRYTLPGS